MLVYVFFMASSFMMFFGVNLSSFVFINFLFNLRNYFFRELIENMTWIKFSVILFGFGAIASVLGTILRSDSYALQNSLIVLPNYIYWVMIILLSFVFIRIRIINLELIYKSIFFAVVVSIIYYLFLQNYFVNSLFFKRFGPNNFSFLLICFAPQALYYTKKRYSLLLGYLLFFLILYIQLSEGRRAGFGLILFSGFFSLNVLLLDKFSINKILQLLIAIFFIVLLYNSKVVEDSIYDFSPRIHQLAYEDTDILFEDRSLLTRFAMVEKGISLFKENPLTGIGLNNFIRKETQIEGNFKGAIFVVNKDIFKGTSSHNSYINVLAEGGLMLFIPLISFLFGIISSFIRNFFSLSNSAKIMFFSFTTMCIHFYFMNAIVNSLAWFNISLANIALTISRED